MIDFKILDEFANEFKDLEKEAVKELEQKKQLPPREAWILERFLDGFTGRFKPATYDAITIIPTSSEIDMDTLLACKEGINEYLLERVGLIFPVSTENAIPRIEAIREGYRERTEKGIVSYQYDQNVRNWRKSDILPKTYIVIVDNADFFNGVVERAIGLASPIDGALTLLDRAARKGRYLDGNYLQMTQKERREYMKTVAAHEAYHMISRLPDIKSDTHKSRGLPDKKNCLGISQFQLPAQLCEGCTDGIRTLWYGVELRTGKRYLKDQ
ncbi:MAG: hypothetical protein U9O94_00950 [Nanoarchaeota archaeon]|nr:hypothetical protein [Nanoarchaeota archaeon]